MTATIEQAAIAIRAHANRWFSDAGAVQRDDDSIEWGGDDEAQAEYERLNALADALQAQASGQAVVPDRDAVDLARQGMELHSAGMPEYIVCAELVRVAEAVAAPTPEPVAVGQQEGLPERDPSVPAEQQGLFRKFDVRRTDGSDQPGGRHHGCRYFVLDIDHDAHAGAALTAYAAACETTHPDLAHDLREKWGAAPALDQQAVRDAALEEAAQALDRLHAENRQYHTVHRHGATAIRALKSTNGGDAK